MSNKNTRWSKTDEDFLTNNYNSFSNSELAELLDRTPKAIEKKAEKLSLKKENHNTKQWTEAEIAFLVENYDYMTNKKMAEILNRTESSVERKAGHLNLTKGNSHKSFLEDSVWTPEELEFLKNNFEKLPLIKLSDKLNKPYREVLYRILTENLHDHESSNTGFFHKIKNMFTFKTQQIEFQ